MFLATFWEVAVFVGIDVSKAMLDVAIRPDGGHSRFPNSEVGIAELVDKLVKLTPTLVVMEATGGYEDACAVALAMAKLPVAVVNPRQVRDFAKAAGKLAKTDKIDCGCIAHFGEAIRPRVTPVDDEVTRELRELVDRRKQLVDMRTAEINRLEHAGSSMKKELQHHIRYLNKRIDDLDKDIRNKIRNSPVWREKDELLQTAAGIGDKTSARLLVSLPELGKVSQKRILALAGLAPFNVDSGQSKGRRKCWGGRADVREALYVATMSAITWNPRISAFYNRLVREQKKPKQLAMIAAAAKLLKHLNAMMRKNEGWRPA